jgi:hypothetical protein
MESEALVLKQVSLAGMLLAAPAVTPFTKCSDIIDGLKTHRRTLPRSALSTDE